MTTTENTQKNNSAGLVLQNPATEMVQMILTRKIDFDKEFTRHYCLDIRRKLEKLIAYDTIMNTPKEELTLRFDIYSYGGECSSLLALAEKIEEMQRMGYKIHTHNMSFSASCGFVLSVIGDYKTSSPYATYLNHQVSSGTYGTLATQQVDVDLTKEFQETFLAIIRKHNPKVAEEELQRPYVTNRDITYNAQQALEAGFIDEIIA